MRQSCPSLTATADEVLWRIHQEQWKCLFLTFEGFLKFMPMMPFRILSFLHKRQLLGGVGESGVTHNPSSSNDLTEKRGFSGSACISASLTSTAYSGSWSWEPLNGSVAPSICGICASLASVEASIVDSSAESMLTGGGVSVDGELTSSAHDFPEEGRKSEAEAFRDGWA